MEPVYLTRIKFNNCQSIVDGEFEFTSGINIIRGDNSYGKSVLMKMIRVAALPNALDKDDRRDFITYGKTSATIHYYFSDKTDAIVEINLDKVIYSMRDLNVSSSYVQSLTPFQRLLDNLSLIIDEETRFIPNLMNGAKDLFFIDSNTVANERLQRASCEHEGLRNHKEFLTRLEHEYKEKEQLAYNHYVKLSFELQGFQIEDTYVREMALLVCEDAVFLLDKTLELQENMDRLVPPLSPLYNVEDMLGLLGYLDELQGINEILYIDGHQNDVRASLESIIDIYQLLEEVQLVAEVNGNILYLVDELTAVEGLLTECKIVKDVTPVLDALDLKMRLMEIVNLLAGYSESSEKAISSRYTLELLEHTMKEYKGTVQCPIYGEVFVENGKCLHDNNRFA